MYVDTCGNTQSCDCGAGAVGGGELQQPLRDRHREPPEGRAFWQTLAPTADPAIIYHKFRLPEQYLKFCSRELDVKPKNLISGLLCS